MNILPALQFHDRIVTGETCHADAIRKAILEHGCRNVSEATKGFLIDGVFFNRAEAAVRAGIPTNIPGLLYSEDLQAAGLLPASHEVAA